MKKRIGLLLGVLLLTSCAGEQTAMEPAAELVATAPSLGTDLEWRVTVPAGEAMEPEEAVVAEAVIEPAHWSTLGFKVGGKVVEVLVEEGDVVAAGDLLVRLDPTDAQLSVRQAEAALEIAQAQLALLQAGPRPEEVTAVEAQLEAAQSTLEQAMAQRDQLLTGPTEAEIAGAEAQVASALAEQKVAYDQHELTMECPEFTFEVDTPIGPRTIKRRFCPALGPLEEQARFGLAAANEGLDAAQAQLDRVLAGADANQIRAAEASVSSAAAQRDATQAQLDLARAGVTAEQIAVAETAVGEAEAGVESAQAALAHAELRAPFTATVTAINTEVGNTMSPGQAACVLATLDQLRARTTDLTELDVRQAVEGKPAIVTVDALPGRRFTGVVHKVALQAEDFRGQVVYAVTVRLMNVTDVPLRWGMTAWVEFEAP